MSLEFFGSLKVPTIVTMLPEDTFAAAGLGLDKMQELDKKQPLDFKLSAREPPSLPCTSVRDPPRPAAHSPSPRSTWRVRQSEIRSFSWT